MSDKPTFVILDEAEGMTAEELYATVQSRFNNLTARIFLMGSPDA